MQIRCQRRHPQFEAYLIVAFAGGAVGDGIGSFGAGDFDQMTSDQGACDGGAEQVFAFVQSVGAQHGKHEIAGEFLAQILDVYVLHAH